MIDKYASKLLSDCFWQHNCSNRRIYASRKSAQHFSVSDFCADCFNRAFYKRIHLPISGTAAHIFHEIIDHLRSFYRMKHFRMKLNCIKLLFCIFCGSYRTVCRVCGYFKSRSNSGNVIEMTHPANCRWWNIIKNLWRSFINQNLCFSIFSHICFLHFPAKNMHHKLCTVAQAKYRNAQFK